MKVIFLDIDGVLNTDYTTARVVNNGVHYLGVDPLLLNRYKRLIDSLPDIKVVLSSTWRVFPELKRALREMGIHWISETPQLGSRGVEIAAWLAFHPEVEKYAIIDDDRDITDEQQPSFFSTNSNVGLTDDMVESIITHLG